METTTFDGPTVTTGDRTVRLTGVDATVAFAAGPVGAFARLARPRLVEVTDPDGSTDTIPIPDVTLIVRVAALALLTLLTLTKGLRR